MSALRTVGSLAVWAALSAALVALGTWPFIGWLRRRQLGKVIRDDVPMHAGKSGTPTMGGIVLVAVVLAMVAVPAVLWGYLGGRWTMQTRASGGDMAFQGVDLRVAIAVAVAILWFGGIGFVDDWQGLARKGRARELGVGLAARHMFALQFLGAIVVAWLLVRPFSCVVCAASAQAWHIWPGVSLMPADIVTRFGLPGWIALGALVLVAVVNGVNLSDGLDGLASGVAFFAFLGLAGVLAITLQPPDDAVVAQSNVVALCLWIAGACLGFLVHNRYPAKVFMGNVTSMALGGALATIALATGTWLLLPVIGIVYVAEILSDVIQVGYFKWTGGKRFFRMAPLHHHFELLGMHETAVTRRFWLAGAAGAAVAVGFVYWATWGVS